MLWMLLMLPGSYDMVSQVEEPVAEAVVEDISEDISEDASASIQEEPQIDIAEEILQEVMKNLSEKDSFLTSKDEEMIRKIVKEEIREALKEVFPPKKEPQVVIPPKTSEKDKEDYEAAALTAVEIPKNKKSEAKKEENKPKCILYLYSMDGCGPCNKAYDELIKDSGQIFELYIGKHPTTFRDGTPVVSYPSYELWKDGEFKKKWSGYTPKKYIIDACNE